MAQQLSAIAQLIPVMFLPFFHDFWTIWLLDVKVLFLQEAILPHLSPGCRRAIRAPPIAHPIHSILMILFSCFCFWRPKEMARERAIDRP